MADALNIVCFGGYFGVDLLSAAAEDGLALDLGVGGFRFPVRRAGVLGLSISSALAGSGKLPGLRACSSARPGKMLVLRIGISGTRAQGDRSVCLEGFRVQSSEFRVKG